MSARRLPLVSVIIPVRNGERWIAETIESVLLQTYGALEIILVDNGSTDGTRNVVRRYPTLRVVDLATPGLGRARNAGLDTATGTYVLFLDGDDLILPNKIERQVHILEATDADVAWEPFQMYVPEPGGGYVRGRIVRPQIGTDAAASVLTAEGWLQVGAILIRRRAIGDLRFDETPGVFEDTAFNVLLATRGARFVQSGHEPGLLYREHDGPRLSRRSPAAFALACADNATRAYELWSNGGPLSAERRIEVAATFIFAARQLSSTDRVAFDQIVARLAEVDPDFVDKLPARVRWIAKLVGYSGAERVAVAYRELKARVAGEEEASAQ
jgi:glycosyltransferase involved in cell wall biosynthesis